jgi:hypothetical protein
VSAHIKSITNPISNGRRNGCWGCLTRRRDVGAGQKRIRKRTNQSTIVDWDKKIVIIKWVCVYGKLDMQRDEVGKETDYIYTYI